MVKIIYSSDLKIVNYADWVIGGSVYVKRLRLIMLITSTSFTYIYIIYLIHLYSLLVLYILSCILFHFSVFWY